MSYVVLVFQKLFGYDRAKATELMLDVHHKGRAVVSSGTREKAELDVFRLHEHGLWATMRQDDVRPQPPTPARVPRDGSYVLNLDDRERELIRQILGEMRALLILDATDPRVRRLYPAAYADDAKKEEEYQQLTHEELRSSRLANVDAVEASIAAELLTEEQLTAWMQAINSLRLVLGTLLDISDDDQELAFDLDDPEARTQALYGYLGGLLDEIVDAQLEVL